MGKDEFGVWVLVMFWSRQIPHTTESSKQSRECAKQSFAPRTKLLHKETQCVLLSQFKLIWFSFIHTHGVTCMKDLHIILTGINVFFYS